MAEQARECVLQGISDGWDLPVGGLERCSFVDFPSRLSAVVFTRGCNLRCQYCHNPSLVDFEGVSTSSNEDLTARDVLKFLSTRMGLLSGVVLTGGEPLCHPKELQGFIRQVRAMGFQVKLDTNGTHPSRLESLLQSEARPDFVAMDFKDVPEGYEALCGAPVGERVLQSLSVLRSSGVAFEVRTTVCGHWHTPQRLLEMGMFLRADERWFLQKFRPGNVLSLKANFAPPGEEMLKRVAQEVTSQRRVRCVVR